MPQSSEKHQLIGIVGPTGAGKTTLAQGLGKAMNGLVYQEKPQDNPFFQQFYDDLHNKVKASVAVMKSELFFLNAAFEQAMAAKESLKKGLVIWDVPIQGHLMYAELLRRQEFLSQAQYDQYKARYDDCLSQIAVPDFFLVATVASTKLSDVEVLVQHMEERGRPEEQATPIAYWQKQVGYWKTLLKQDQQVRHLVLNAAEIDWRTDEGVERVVQIIRKAI